MPVAMDTASRIAAAHGVSLTETRRRVFGWCWMPGSRSAPIADRGDAGWPREVMPPTVYRALPSAGQGAGPPIESLNAFIACTRSESDHEASS